MCVLGFLVQLPAMTALSLGFPFTLWTEENCSGFLLSAFRSDLFQPFLKCMCWILLACFVGARAEIKVKMSRGNTKK